MVASNILYEPTMEWEKFRINLSARQRLLKALSAKGTISSYSTKVFLLCLISVTILSFGLWETFYPKIDDHEKEENSYMWFTQTRGVSMESLQFFSMMEN